MSNSIDYVKRNGCWSNSQAVVKNKIKNEKNKAICAASVEKIKESYDRETERETEKTRCDLMKATYSHRQMSLEEKNELALSLQSVSIFFFIAKILVTYFY